MMKLINTIILLSLVSFLSGCILEDGSMKVGMVAPSIQTKTLADVNGDLSRITTYRYPDKRMYQYSLDIALKEDKPIILAFATPGHCTSCDKHLQVLKAIMNKYQGDVLFLHMDQYMNPEAFHAFKVLGDPWTFVLDRNNIVKFKRAGRMLFREVDIMLTELLEDQSSKENSAG